MRQNSSPNPPSKVLVRLAVDRAVEGLKPAGLLSFHCSRQTAPTSPECPVTQTGLGLGLASTALQHPWAMMSEAGGVWLHNIARIQTFFGVGSQVQGQEPIDSSCLDGWPARRLRPCALCARCPPLDDPQLSAPLAVRLRH